MRGRDKPFVMYRRGPASFTIVPRGVMGWLQFALWLILLGALVIWFTKHVHLIPNNENYFEGVVLFAIGVFLWMVGGLWWMRARAEIVEVAELTRDRQRERRKQRRDR